MTAIDTGRPVVKRDAKSRERNLTRLQARQNSELARAEFASTLNALEDKLNVPKQLNRATARLKARVQQFADEQPGAALAVAVGVAAAVGATVWLVVRKIVDDE
jgi:hypothetical protein